MAIELKRGLELFWIAHPDYPGEAFPAHVSVQCERETAPQYGQWSIDCDNSGGWFTDKEIQEQFIEPPKDALEQLESIIQNEPLDAGDTLMGSIAQKTVDFGWAKVDALGRYYSTPLGQRVEIHARYHGIND